MFTYNITCMYVQVLLILYSMLQHLLSTVQVSVLVRQKASCVMYGVRLRYLFFGLQSLTEIASQSSGLVTTPRYTCIASAEHSADLNYNIVFPPFLFADRGRFEWNC